MEGEFRMMLFGVILAGLVGAGLFSVVTDLPIDDTRIAQAEQRSSFLQAH